MKFCPNSSNCPYGSAFKENTCAYYDNETDYNCPLWAEDWETKIDELNKNLN